MRTSPRKVLTVLIAAIVILLGATLTAAKLCPTANVSNGGPALAQPGWRLAPPIAYDNLTIFPVVSSDDANTSDPTISLTKRWPRATRLSPKKAPPCAGCATAAPRRISQSARR